MNRTRVALDRRPLALQADGDGDGDGDEIVFIVDAANTNGSVADLRLEGRIDAAALEQAVARGWFGLIDDLATDPPFVAPDRTVWIEIRSRQAPTTRDTGTPSLQDWADRLFHVGTDDPSRSAAAWVVSRLGSSSPDGPPQRTVWHHLEQVDDDADPADALDAVVAFLRDGIGDPDALVGIDAAAELLHRWFGEADDTDAVRLAALDLDEVGRRRGASDLLAAVHDVLVADGVEPVVLDGGRGLVFSVEGTTITWHAVVEQRDADTLVVFSLSPIALPLARFVESLELIARLNRELTLSAFDLDVDSGELALRTGIDLGAATDPTDTIRRALGSNLHTLDAHLPALQAFVDGATPVACIDLLGPDPAGHAAS